MWNGTMFVDLDWPLNASSLLSASAELLVLVDKVKKRSILDLEIFNRRTPCSAHSESKRP